jgi:integrase
MPTTNKLTDNLCRKAPEGKHFDGHGLYLSVAAERRVWRMAYRIAGKPQTATFGPFPLVSLADARRKRDELRRLLVDGKDPRPEPARHTPAWKDAVDAYWRGRKDVTDGYRDNAKRGLAMHLKELDAIPIGAITREQLLAPLNRMDAAGKHVYVRRVRVWAAQVFDWAVEHGHRTDNPARSIQPEKAFGKAPVESFAALSLDEVPAFMERIALEGELQSVLACKLLALTWARTGELRMMLWSEIDGDLWRIPEGKMKRRRDHLVPLSTQALKLLDKLAARSRGEYVFPADHRADRPMSENAVLYLLHRMGYRGRMTGHGWRSIGSTWANEHGYTPDAIERQLAHAPEDKVRSVYNRAAYLPERRKMLQAWADFLIG